MFYEHNQSKSVMCTDLCLIWKTRAGTKCRAVQSWCYSRMPETDEMGPGRTRSRTQRQGSLGIKEVSQAHLLPHLSCCCVVGYQDLSLACMPSGLVTVLLL